MITKKTRLSLTTDGTTINIEFDNFDVDLDQYFHAFKTLMVGATYSEKQFDQWIMNQAECLIGDLEDDDDSEIPICTDASRFDFNRTTQ
jgi:hypothetical protein